jgi:hypothetical protein
VGAIKAHRYLMMSKMKKSCNLSGRRWCYLGTDSFPAMQRRYQDSLLMIDIRDGDGKKAHVNKEHKT